MRTDMRTSILLGSLLAALLSFSSTAHAQAQDFGNKGQLAISGDTNLSFTGTSLSDNGGSSFTFLIQPSVDYFVIDNLSLGGFVAYEHTSVSPGGTGNSTNVDTFGIGPRVGYDFRIGNSFSFWPKAMIEYATTSSSTGGQSNGDNSWEVGVFAPFLLHPAEHFFLGLGPIVTTQLSNSASASQNGQTVSTDAPKATTYGIAFTLGGWVGL